MNHSPYNLCTRKVNTKCCTHKDLATTTTSDLSALVDKTNLDSAAAVGFATDQFSLDHCSVEYLERQEFSARQQKPEGLLDDYVDFVQKMSNHLNQSPKERMHVFC